MRGKPVKVITGFRIPYRLALSNAGDIVVPQHGKCSLTVISKDGMRRELFGISKGEMITGKGVAFTNDGHILVIVDDCLRKLTTDGVCVKSVGSSGSGHLQFCFPEGIAVHPTTGQIFVADSSNKRIQVFTNDLVYSHSITSSWLIRPKDVALDDEGYLYVVDNLKDCIIKLTVKGEFIAGYGSYGSAPGELSSPSSVTIGNNLVYVSECGNNRLSVFDTTGKFLHCFGKKGSGEGEFNHPVGITTDTSGNLYISDCFNNRIVVFKV